MKRKTPPLFHAIAAMLMAGIMLLAPGRVLGQEQVAFENAEAQVSFGKEIVFTAKLSPADSVQQVSIFFHTGQENAARAEPVAAGQDGWIRHSFDASQRQFLPFSWVEYWYQVTLLDGQVITSETYRVQYHDDRFSWRELSRSGLTVHWYAGDEAFGASALDAAAMGSISIQNLVPQPVSGPVDIYIYANPADLQAGLPQAAAEWVGGHADPAAGVVLTAIVPGESQSVEMQTKIPHELTHVMLYRSLGAGYALQPRWLVEGMAAIMEQYPNPDYAQALLIAEREGSRIAMNDLCEAFPVEGSRAYLAYAQSQSFVSYIKEIYGTPGLKRLMEQYGSGYPCELGAANALGTSLSELDLRWREAAPIESIEPKSADGGSLRNLLPFVLLLGLVLLVPLWGVLEAFSKPTKS